MRNFYQRREWQSLRYRVLVKYGRKCMMCNASADDGAEIHVDHIKPISIFPEMALQESNLQVLCRACNLGKSNKWDHDFRTPSTVPVKQVMKRVKLSRERRHTKAISRLSVYIKKLLSASESAGDMIETARLMRAYLKLQQTAKNIVRQETA